MSSHKKRRIDGVDSPKPMSAIAALAARRREAAASSSQAAQSPSEPEEKPVASNTNYFSVLQKRDSQNGASSTPKKSTVKAPRSQSGTESPASHSRNRGLARVIQGEVRVAGATLCPSETIEWVHAPHCHAVPVLRTAEETRLELHPDQNARGLRQLGRISPLFRKMWNEPSESATKINKEPTFQLIHTSEDAPKKCIIQDLVSPPAWNKKLSSLITTSRKKPSLSTFICGPKSSGKSTFSRLLLNRLLTDPSQSQTPRCVVILDLDPGQPEYTPPGTLSLVAVTKPNLGTPFTHPGVKEPGSNIVRCHSIASMTPASDPDDPEDLYLKCVDDLFDTYSKNFAGIPLIINTPGWILGTGFKLLTTLIERMKPEEVLYMSEDGPPETVDGLRAATETTFTELPSQPSEFTSRTAAHLRAMQTMSYFHLQDLTSKTPEQSDIPPRLKWNSSPLSVRSPLLVQYSSSKRGILGLMSYDFQCPPELLADTVSGMVLAAVEIEDAKAFSRFTQGGNSADAVSGTSELVSKSPEGIPFIPIIPNFDDPGAVFLDPQYSRTIGFVLLRGIDTKSQTLQLISPIPLEDLKRIKSQGRDIVLLYGKFDSPSWAYAEELYERAGADEGNDTMLEVTDEDTDDDQSEAEPEVADRVSDLTEVPWVEVLKGNQRRPVGSKVWRVRRDLGRNNAGE
ncbi:polynucleotide 5'-hydroxyl-kinase GRC3 [Fusarium austroafricanum]|uniref:Polynucleotide 5'-hydroxyl-kinase GRC3 n=1 Tax=Fusarium austroafricanum TaxID=2364996 RepID=A0A8H4KF74_9HYPO|nr:polynucleotide 5'-hydroxyl-kinase GRC3 [Fusarium austroafricanum]